jgi:hypothetical protein
MLQYTFWQKKLLVNHMPIYRFRVPPFQLVLAVGKRLFIFFIAHDIAEYLQYLDGLFKLNYSGFHDELLGKRICNVVNFHTAYETAAMRFL